MGLEFYSGAIAGVGVVLIGAWIRDRAPYRDATRRPAGTAPRTVRVDATGESVDLEGQIHIDNDRLLTEPMTSGMPRNLAPMLATAGPLPTPDEDFAHEIKWDGVRTLVSVDRGSVRLVTRNANDVTASYPELQALAGQVGQRSLLLDAEVAAMNGRGRTDFSLIQSRMHVRRPSKALLESTPVQLLIFDLLRVNDQSLLTSTYDERRRRLADLSAARPQLADSACGRR